MRKQMIGMAAALAASLAAAPAMACGVSFGCAQPVYSPCSPCGGASAFERFSAPAPHVHVAAPRYYYVDQGPTYSGAGMFAPAPTYQERAVSGWSGYEQPYYYGYTGGPYADPSSHYYDGMPATRAPAMYSYRPRPAYYSMRRVTRYGWAPRYHRVHRAAPAYYAPAPRYAARPSLRYGYAPRYAPAPRYGYAPRRAYAPVYRPAPRYGYAPRYMPTPRLAPAQRFAPAPRYGHGPNMGYAPRIGVAPRMHPPVGYGPRRPMPYGRD